MEILAKEKIYASCLKEFFWTEIYIFIIFLFYESKLCTYWYELSLSWKIWLQILEISRQILALYELWKNYDEKKEISGILEKMPKPKTT